MVMKLGALYRSVFGFVALGLLLCVSAVADAQEIRNYNVQRATGAINADGTISPGEWDAADPAAGDWRELRQPFTDVDEDNNRFRALWDDNNLYILYETDYDFGWLNNLGGVRPDIVFGEENLNLYIDPNRDGDLNTDIDGNPLDPGVSNGSNTDGYQIAFNQYEGMTVTTDADFQGVGVFTEAHVNSPFGDQADWNEGGSNVGGAGLAGSNIVIAQNNTNANGGSGVAEIVIPFADLDALSSVELDPANNPGVFTDTGLNATDDGARTGPVNGEVWGFNMSMITRDGDNNFLPIWNHHDNSSFAPWPHGMFTFIDDVDALTALCGEDIDGDCLLAVQQDDPSLTSDWEGRYGDSAAAVAAVPEPSCGLLAMSAVLMSLARRRRS